MAIGERNTAVRQQAIALSRQVATDSLAANATDPLTARQLAVAAWRVFPTDQAYSSMSDLLAGQWQDGTLYAGANTNGDVSGVAFSPDGTLLASAELDGSVRLWSAVTGQAAGSPLRASAKYGANAVAFSPDGKLLATADGDGTARLWNPATGRPIGSPLPAGSRAESGYVSDVAFSPDGKLLVSMDGNGRVRLWDPVTGRPVSSPRLAAIRASGRANEVAFSPDGKLLANVGPDVTAQLWDLSSFASPYAALCAEVGAPTRQDWDQYASGEPLPAVCS